MQWFSPVSYTHLDVYKRQVNNSENVQDFTAVGYFFAKKLYQELKVPIGILNISWGGTNIETWIGRDAFEGSEDFKNMISKMQNCLLYTSRCV